VTKTPVAILISGRGSNMRALVEAARAEDYPARIVAVISNRADAEGLVFAASEGIPTAVVDHRAFADRLGFDRALNRELMGLGAEFVACAGFMRIMTPWLAAQWQGRMINIHPSLLPAYQGLNTHARALADGAKHHGCTVHWVSAGVDEGETIAQAEVPVLPGDTPESLAARVLQEEHRLYSKALAMALGKAA
jgi:phosphoribosylglycinamide formyltransferase 1